MSDSVLSLYLCQNCFCLPSEKQFSLKDKNMLPKNMLPKGTFVFYFQSGPIFQRDLVCRKPKRKSQMLSALVMMAEKSTRAQLFKTNDIVS